MSIKIASSRWMEHTMTITYGNLSCANSWRKEVTSKLKHVDLSNAQHEVDFVLPKTPSRIKLGSTQTSPASAWAPLQSESPKNATPGTIEQKGTELKVLVHTNGQPQWQNIVSWTGSLSGIGRIILKIIQAQSRLARGCRLSIVIINLWQHGTNKKVIREPHHDKLNR